MAIALRPTPTTLGTASAANRAAGLPLLTALTGSPTVLPGAGSAKGARLVTGQPARGCHSRLNTICICYLCDRCQYVSLGEGDCSWYNSCARLDAGERSSDLDAHFRSMRVSTPREYAGQFNLPMDERANGLPTGQQTNGPTDAQRTNGPPTGAPTPSRRRAPTTDRHCYATLLSHSSFLPGTLALLHSLRAGGALLPATVLATPETEPDPKPEPLPQP